MPISETKLVTYSWNLFLVLALDHNMPELGNLSIVLARTCYVII